MCLKLKKNICSPSPSTSNALKIAQLGEVMEKIWDVWCKRIQCSMMGEFKQNKISNLKYFIIASFASRIQRSL
jgi:hypothetical protein